MTQDHRLKLRPVEREDLALLDSWVNDVEAVGEFNSFGLEARQGSAASFDESGFLSDERGILLVEIDDGQIIGRVNYWQVRYGPNWGSRAFAIGISLLPNWRGQGWGTEAQRRFAEYLLSTYPINRVEAETDVENTAEQRCLEKAGFHREGVLRGAQWRDGRWHDLVLYSRLRADGSAQSNSIN
ncbi:MAG: GNAT family protein [Anaerolineales bacterium]